VKNISGEIVFSIVAGEINPGEIIRRLDNIVWGPWLLVLLLGTGCYLMLRLRFLPLKNLKFALKSAFGGEKSKSESGPTCQSDDRSRLQWKKAKRNGNGSKNGARRGTISSFASLTTELAITLGTGNIIGVATAMVLGGPGALFWMVVTSVIGMATKLVESMLSVKYRGFNEKGERAGGPMYTCLHIFPGRKTGRRLGAVFAFLACLASFGMGNMTQSNSIADAMWFSFEIPKAKTGLILTIITILVVLGGIGVIGKVTQILVPFMGIFYLLGTIIVIVANWRNLPEAIVGILAAAVHPQAVSGGLFGSVTVTAFESLRWGVSRGVFSNEAGLGAAGITTAAADTEDCVKQGYISMTGVFLDTVVICTITGLAFAVSGVIGSTDASGVPLTGTELTLAAFSSTLGELGGSFVSICIVLFAFATIIGWAYQGERAFEFLMGGRTKYNLIYRFVYALSAFCGCICSLETVWNFSDVCNGLMAVPNLICVLVLSGKACREICAYAVPAQKAVPGKKLVLARELAPVQKAVPSKKLVFAQKLAPTQKSIPGKKPVSAQKSVSGKKINCIDNCFK